MILPKGALAATLVAVAFQSHVFAHPLSDARALHQVDNDTLDHLVRIAKRDTANTTTTPTETGSSNDTDPAAATAMPCGQLSPNGTTDCSLTMAEEEATAVELANIFRAYALDYNGNNENETSDGLHALDQAIAGERSDIFRQAFDQPTTSGPSYSPPVFNPPGDAQFADFNTTMGQVSAAGNLALFDGPVFGGSAFAYSGQWRKLTIKTPGEANPVIEMGLSQDGTSMVIQSMAPEFDENIMAKKLPLPPSELIFQGFNRLQNTSVTASGLKSILIPGIVNAGAINTMRQYLGSTGLSSGTTFHASFMSEAIPEHVALHKTKEFEVIDFMLANQHTLFASATILTFDIIVNDAFQSGPIGQAKFDLLIILSTVLISETTTATTTSAAPSAAASA